MLPVSPNASGPGRRHRRARRLGLAVTLGLTALLAGCGHSSAPDAVTSSSAPATTTTAAPTTTSTTMATTTAPTTTPPTTDPVAAATAAFPAFAGTLGQGQARSTVATSGAGIYAAVSFNVEGQGTIPHVVIARYDGGTWTRLADLALDVGGTVVPGTTPITVVHLTGAATPDFAVAVSSNSFTQIALASAAGGQWHLVDFTGGPGGTEHEATNATITGQSITEDTNSCTPSCADGNETATTYRWSGATGTMVAIATD